MVTEEKLVNQLLEYYLDHGTDGIAYILQALQEAMPYRQVHIADELWVTGVDTKDFHELDKIKTVLARFGHCFPNRMALLRLKPFALMDSRIRDLNNDKQQLNLLKIKHEIKPIIEKKQVQLYFPQRATAACGTAGDMPTPNKGRYD